MNRWALRCAALAAGGVYGTLQWLGRTAGTTTTERRRALPGDDLVTRPMIVTDHAVTIAAPRDQIWPWLVQMGWHRAGWYTAHWVDRLLFPGNWPSAENLLPGLQHCAVGDFIPDGPPDSRCGFVVERLEPNSHLVLHSRSHLPPSWQEHYGAWLDWTWTFVLDEVEGETRFQFRSRGRMGPWWVRAGYVLAIVPADFFMARQMLHGVKTRTERRAAAATSDLKSSRPHSQRHRSLSRRGFG